MGANIFFYECREWIPFFPSGLKTKASNECPELKEKKEPTEKTGTGPSIRSSATSLTTQREKKIIVTKNMCLYAFWY